MPKTSNSLTLYRQMLRLRMVEETIAERYGEQEIRCPVHLSIGQEAIAVGTCAALERDDVAVSTHRCHAHYLAKGGGLKAMLAELYGKATGCCGGRGGSMHLFDDDAGLLVSVPIVSSSIPLAVGAALAFEQRGLKQVSVVFMGDASIEEGVFHESANFAVLRKLPVLFICENNLYSVYTPLAERQPTRDLVDVAKAHAMPGCRADGNDVDVVHDAVAEAVALARRGNGPSFLAFDTYRWREHCGPNYDNHLGYRSKTEFEAWKDNCPVESYRHAIEDAGLWNAEHERSIRDEIAREIDEAFAFAKNSPFPDAATAGDLVYG